MSNKNQKDAVTFHNHLAVLEEALGYRVNQAIGMVHVFAEKYGGDKLDVAVFGTWMVAVPKGAKDVRKDAVLAIEMRTNTILIDEIGAFGTPRSSKEVYEAFKHTIAEEILDSSDPSNLH